MPEYTYKDAHGHVITIAHRMGYTTGIICWTCGDEMQRSYQGNVNIAFAGLKPSKGEIHPKLKKFIDDAPKRRERFAQEHHEHEQRTAHEHD